MNEQVPVIRIEMIGVVRSVKQVEIGHTIDVQYFMNDADGNPHQVEDNFNILVPNDPFLTGESIKPNDKLHIIAYSSKGLGITANKIRLFEYSLPPYVISTTSA